MPNERDEWRNRRGRDRDDRSRDERGDYGRFSADEDRGGRGRSMWGGGGGQELRSVGSPGIGGGTGGAWDQGSPEREEWSGAPPSRGGGFRGKGPMNYQRSDQRIREDVCEYLTDDDEVDASEIDVKVEQCEVTLTGNVSSRDMKRRAEHVAERASGVRDIHNQLKVNGKGSRE
jgi:hypothetical protein